MAGNNYKLLLEAQLDPQKIQAQINALSNKSVMNIKMDFAQGDMAKFEAELEKIKTKASSIGKVTLFGSEKDGVTGINRAVVEYKDALGNVVQEYLQINSEVAITQKYTENIAKDKKEILALETKSLALEKKQADEMERAGKEADLFLAKSKNLASTPSVQAAIGKATDLKNAVSEGDIAKVRKFKDELDLAKAALQTGRTGLDSWSEGMRNAIKQTIEYATSVGLVYGALSQLREGIQYLTDLDKQMTAIQVVTGYTDEQIGKLSLQFNGLAKDLGATTLEVAKGSTEWFRQGKTIEETSQLMESSMMMSKLANMDSAQSTEYLTSIINGFKLEAQDTQDVISKLVSLDNEFATSTSEIASAMQRSSVSAQQAGVSMEELASMITVVSDVSRRAPESIGESFKTMFARYQDILSGQVDEEGMGINNVGKALERVGVSIRDVDGGFRDFGDVLDDLYPKWHSLNEVEQANILKALAGTRQRESLLVLLENETKYRKALTVQMESEGLAAERYATYLDSVEAAQNRAKSSIEKLWMTTTNSDVIKNFYNITAAILESVDAMGGLVPLLTTVGAAYLAFSGKITSASLAMAMSKISIDGIILSIYDLGVAIDTLLISNPVGWAILLVGGIVMIANAIPTTIERLDTLNEKFKTIQNEIKKVSQESNKISELANKFEELSKIKNKDAQQTQDWIDVQNQLKEMMPSLIGHYDEYGNFIIQDTDAIAGLIDQTERLIEVQKRLDELKSEAEETSSKRAGLLEKLYNESQTEFLRGTGAVKSQEQIKESVELYKEALEKEKGTFQLMGYQSQLAYIEGLKNPDLKQLFIDYQNDLYQSYANQASSGRLTGLAAMYGEYPTPPLEEYAGFSETISKLNSQFSDLNSLIEKSSSSQLEFSDIQKIPEEYLDALSVENGQLRLNVDLIKEKQVAEAEAAYKSAVAAGESEKYTEVLRLYYEQLKESQNIMLNGVEVTAGAFNQLAWSIAQNAAMSGNSFVDMQGKALNSTEAIYKYLTSGDAAFNDFVRQAANITGMSVQQIMQQINMMLLKTQQNAYAVENSLRGMSGVAYGGGGNYDPLRYAIPTQQSTIDTDLGIFTPAPSGYQYPGGLSDYSGGGGGTSSQNAELEQQRDLEKQIQEIEKQIEDARKNAVDDLKDQLDVYKDIIDARKEIIDTLADERAYQQDVENKNKEILRVQNELATLQFDTSEEANARRLELQDELSNLNQDLENIQYDQSVEVQKKALDDEYSSFESKINSMIKQIEGIQATSVSDFANQLSSIMASLSTPPKGSSFDHNTTPTFHEGGVVGKGMSLKSNEMFAKLLKGEVVSTPNQIDTFMNKTLPQMIDGTSNFAGGNIELNMPVNINGNAGDSIIPDLDKFAEKLLTRLQQMMNQRGWNRRGDLFQM
jgi:TP901 family phage tail tape measure protein